MERPVRRQLDLADELVTLRQALEAVRLLTETLVNDRAADQETSAAATRSAIAVTDLLVERMRAIESGVRGTADVGPLITRANSAVGPADGGVRLKAWDAGRIRAEAKRELRRVKFEQAAGRSRTRR